MSLYHVSSGIKSQIQRDQGILDAAIEYSSRLHLSVVFVGRDKKPLEKWDHLRHRRRKTERIHDGWIECLHRHKAIGGVAVVFGPASDWLIGRDFDDEDGYHRWADQNPEIASETPTVRTKRGFLALCRVRSAHGLANTVFAATDPGEIRTTNYSILPPSVHHSGFEYHWHGHRPETCEDIPVYGSIKTTGWQTESALPTSPTVTPTARHTHTYNKPTETFFRTPGGHRKQTQDCVLRSLPHGHGQRWHAIVGLVLRLKDLSFVDDDQAKEAFELWWQRSESVVKTKDYAESMRDFCSAWKGIESTMIRCRTGRLLAERLALPLPIVPDAMYEFRNCLPTRRLLAVCDVLQANSMGHPFPLSGQYAARVCGFRTQQTVSNRIGRMCELGYLERVTRGVVGADTERIASTYRFLGIRIG